jgi:hypothetical protein
MSIKKYIKYIISAIGLRCTLDSNMQLLKRSKFKFWIQNKEDKIEKNGIVKENQCCTQLGQLHPFRPTRSNLHASPVIPSASDAGWWTPTGQLLTHTHGHEWLTLWAYMSSGTVFLPEALRNHPPLSPREHLRSSRQLRLYDPYAHIIRLQPRRLNPTKSKPPRDRVETTSALWIWGSVVRALE